MKIVTFTLRVAPCEEISVRGLPVALEMMVLGYLYYLQNDKIFVPIIAHGFGDFFGG